VRLTRTRRVPRTYASPPSGRAAGPPSGPPPGNGDAPADDPLAPFAAFEVALAEAAVVPEVRVAEVREQASVAEVVNAILEHAFRNRASDVHIEPGADCVRVRVRTDGALHNITTLASSLGPALIRRIKHMAAMNVDECRRPQDGQIAITIGGRELDARVLTTPTAFGEKCVLRMHDTSRAVIELSALGMAPDTFDRYHDLIRSPSGMVICAGPTRSGTTTTMYATLTAIDTDEINVVTIEDPIEHVFPTFNQIQVDDDAGLTFEHCLRSVIEQDPDAVLVSELPDVVTACLASRAALEGRFVISSLHATDATSALRRFIDMGVEPHAVASSVRAVVGQRLLRRVCEHCAGPGCNHCGHTGYAGRIGIYEVLTVTDEMKDLIVANAGHAQLRALAIAQGMTTLRNQAIGLVTANRTTTAEVLRTVNSQ
jgi:type IV pilus assembly protein PilB